MSINSPANQYATDVRQMKCWELYANPKSKWFGNAYQAAMEAGYEESYAATITTIEWFKEKTRRLGMLAKAEKVLEEMLEMPVEVLKLGSEEQVVKTDPSLVRIKQDTAKFIASTQGKDHGYSTRSEVTGKDGETLITESNVSSAVVAAALAQLQSTYVSKADESSLSSEESDAMDSTQPSQE